jgi:hypothetical protein
MPHRGGYNRGGRGGRGGFNRGGHQHNHHQERVEYSLVRCYTGLHISKHI